MAQCLEHRDDIPSMAIYSDHVFCFGCERYWWPDEFITQLGGKALDTRKTAYRQAAPARPIPRSMVETYSRWLLEGPFQDRLEWLQARGLLLDTLEANVIGHCGNAYTIPVLNEDGSVASIRYRRDDKLAGDPGPKYWGTRGANKAMLYRPKPTRHAPQAYIKTLYLTEGELDALILAQEGLHAISLTNGAGAFNVEHVALIPDYVTQVFVVYDQDDIGRSAGNRIVGLIGPRAKQVMWPEVLGKDVTNLLTRYPLAAFNKFVNMEDSLVA